jgi:hypothetical protein
MAAKNHLFSSSKMADTKIVDYEKISGNIYLRILATSGFNSNIL